jgi:hypothetical protein
MKSTGVVTLGTAGNLRRKFNSSLFPPYLKSYILQMTLTKQYK